MMPIHLDEEIAKSVGFPGIIIHGLCTMAFNSIAIVGQLCDGETERLKRLAVRFSRPALPGQDDRDRHPLGRRRSNGRAAYASRPR